MLKQCQLNSAKWKLDGMLCLGTAEQLPFKDQVFDVDTNLRGKSDNLVPRVPIPSSATVMARASGDHGPMPARPWIADPVSAETPRGPNSPHPISRAGFAPRRTPCAPVPSGQVPQRGTSLRIQRVVETPASDDPARSPLCTPRSAVIAARPTRANPFSPAQPCPSEPAGIRC